MSKFNKTAQWRKCQYCTAIIPHTQLERHEKRCKGKTPCKEYQPVLRRANWNRRQLGKEIARDKDKKESQQ